MSRRDVHHLTALLLRLLIKSNGCFPRFFYCKAIKASWNLILWGCSLLPRSTSEPSASSLHPSNFWEYILCAGSMRTEPIWKPSPAQAQGSLLICLSKRAVTAHTLCFVGCCCDSLCPLDTQVCPNPTTVLRISGRVLNRPKNQAEFSLVSFHCLHIAVTICRFSAAVKW